MEFTQGCELEAVKGVRRILSPLARSTINRQLAELANQAGVIVTDLGRAAQRKAPGHVHARCQFLAWVQTNLVTRDYREARNKRPVRRMILVGEIPETEDGLWQPASTCDVAAVMNCDHSTIVLQRQRYRKALAQEVA